MKTNRSDLPPTPTSANKGRKRLRLRSRSNTKKPTALVRPILKIAPPDPSLTMAPQQFNPTPEMDNGTNWNATSSPMQYREPYQPLCEPITPEPLEEISRRPNNDRMANCQIQIDEKMKEFLDTIVILGEMLRRKRIHSVPPTEDNLF